MIIRYYRHALRLALTDEAGLLAQFIEQYFTPYFDIVPRNAAAVAPFATLRVETGTPRHAPDFASANPIVVDASKGFLNCTGYPVAADDSRWIKLMPFEAIVQVRARAREIRLWGRDEERLRIPTLRLIEDLFSNQLQSSGALLVHASAVVTSAGAILAIGNKGAGKTTILSRWLGHFDVAKMANDNVCLYVHDGKVVARGWPTFYKVQLGTVATTAELTSDFPPDTAEILDDDGALWSYYEKVALYPRQAAERFGRRVTPEAVVAGIIFPSFSRTHVPRIERLTPDQWLSQFPNYLQGVFNPNHPEWLHFNEVDRASLQTTLEEVRRILAAQTAEVYRLDWAPSVEDLLARIPALRRENENLNAARRGSRGRDDWQSLRKL